MDKPSPPAAPLQPARTPGPELQARRDVHWRKTRRLTAILLLVWLLTGFIAFYAWRMRRLDRDFHAEEHA